MAPPKKYVLRTWTRLTSVYDHHPLKFFESPIAPRRPGPDSFRTRLLDPLVAEEDDECENPSTRQERDTPPPLL